MKPEMAELRHSGVVYAVGLPDTVSNRRSRSPRQTGSTPRLSDPLNCLSPVTKPAQLPTNHPSSRGMSVRSLWCAASYTPSPLGWSIHVGIS